MENLYYGFAAGGIVAAVAWYFLRKHKQNMKPFKEDNAKKSNNIKKDQKQQSSMTPATTTETITNKSNTNQAQKTVMFKPKKIEELEQEYHNIFFGSFRLKPSNSVHLITALDFKGSKLLISTTKNQMVLFNLKGWKKQSKQSSPEKYFVSLDNNGASAVCIGQKYYYAALTFDKTIVYYEFKGQGGVYFKQVGKFARNLFKSNVSAIHVSKAENYIVTTGSGSDTIIDVWSMKGQRLASTNSFQIEHYGTSCGLKDILIRGWTSQVKIFSTIEEKDGGFKKLDKKQHLTHDESPLSAAICNRDMFALSISKHHRVKIWHLFDTLSHRTIESSPELHQQFAALNFTKCSLYTSQPLVGHFKSIVVLAYSTGVLITDINLKVLHRIDGFEIQNIYMNGTNKSVVLGILTTKSQMLLWNLSKDLEQVGEINL